MNLEGDGLVGLNSKTGLPRKYHFHKHQSTYYDHPHHQHVRHLPTTTKNYGYQAHHNLNTQLLPHRCERHHKETHQLYPTSQFSQHTAERYNNTFVSNLCGTQCKPSMMMNNILETAPPHVICSNSTSVNGPFQQIPVIQGIPRHQEVTSEIPTRPTTNNQLLVCLTPNVTIKKEPSSANLIKKENISNSDKKRRCRVDITTLPGWPPIKSPAAAIGRTSSMKKNNLKKRWTKRYQESKPARLDREDLTSIKGVDNLMVQKELKNLKKAHARIEQQVSIQKRRQKKLRQDMAGLLGKMLQTDSCKCKMTYQLPKKL